VIVSAILKRFYRYNLFQQRPPEEVFLFSSGQTLCVPASPKLIQRYFFCVSSSQRMNTTQFSDKSQERPYRFEILQGSWNQCLRCAIYQMTSYTFGNSEHAFLKVNSPVSK
jgi:hypothetical protein